MRILCIDLSLHCGYAVLESETQNPSKLITYGTIHYEGTSIKDYDNYPWSYINVIQSHISNVMWKVREHCPDIIVIEETNRGKARYTQKVLEFLHYEFLHSVRKERPDLSVVYLDTSHWRSVLGIWMNKDQKKQNAKLSAAKRQGPIALKAMKQQLGVKGRVNKKHVAIAHVNQVFGLSLKVKENDAADAICLGLAYLKGAKPSNGE